MFAFFGYLLVRNDYDCIETVRRKTSRLDDVLRSDGEPGMTMLSRMDWQGVEGIEGAIVCYGGYTRIMVVEPVTAALHLHSHQRVPFS